MISRIVPFPLLSLAGARCASEKESRIKLEKVDQPDILVEFEERGVVEDGWVLVVVLVRADPHIHAHHPNLIAGVALGLFHALIKTVNTFFYEIIT